MIIFYWDLYVAFNVYKSLPNISVIYIKVICVFFICFYFYMCIYVCTAHMYV